MRGTVTEGTLTTADGEALPLERTDVQAVARGPLAEVEIRQRFRNPLDRAIEAVYVFPLPHEAAVFRMQFVIRERVVKAVVKEKEEARRAYQQALAEGRAASLLEQESAAVFTLSVANVPAGEAIEVTLAYHQPLAYDDGMWRFVFPMVAADRYDASGTGGVRPPRARKTERPFDVSLTVDVDADERPSSPSHAIEVGGAAPSWAVRLSAADSIPNRDFVLSWPAAGRGVRSRVWFEREAGRPGAFLLSLTPPPFDADGDVSVGGGLHCANCGGPLEDRDALRDVPGIGLAWKCRWCMAVTASKGAGRGAMLRDVVVVVDHSASMRTCARVRQAVEQVVQGLHTDDGVRVLAFHHDLKWMDEGWRPASAVGAPLQRFLETLTARGGTELEVALEKAADVKARDGRARVVVLVTDGAVGNEGRLLRRVGELSFEGLYVLGVGPAPHRWLIEKLARAGGGASEVFDDEAALARFVRRVREAGPVLRDLSLEWADAGPVDVYPNPLPALFSGQAMRMVGRFTGTGESRLVLSGTWAGGAAFRMELDVPLPEAAREVPGLERMWARMRVESLLDRLLAQPTEVSDVRLEVIGLALRHALVTPYTSLVAEDSEVVASPGEAERVEVPAPPTFDDEVDWGGVPAAEPLETTLALAEGAASPPAAMLRSAMPAPAAMAPPMPGGPPSPVSASLADRGSRRSADAPPLLAKTRGGGGFLTPTFGGGSGIRVDLLPTERKAMSAGWLGVPLALAAAPFVGLARGASALYRRLRGDRAESPLAHIPSSRQKLDRIGDEYAAAELEWLRGRDIGALDLVFVVDETGSMGPYIEQVKTHLLALVDMLKGLPLCRGLRLGLVTYRDHPPQDPSFVTRIVPLTDDIEKVRRGVAKMAASGGGDAPEAVIDGLHELLHLDWGASAARVAVLVGDAPPHGVGSPGDGFPSGCPCGWHWHVQAESCRETGVVVHAVCCGTDPYTTGVWEGVAKAARGLFLPLRNAALLVPLIASVAERELDAARIREHVAEVVREHQAALQQADGQEQVRFVTDVLRDRAVRRLDLVGPGAAELRFRDVTVDDVEAGLDGLRRMERVAL